MLGGISLKVRPQIVGEGVLLRHVYIEDVGQAWLDFRFWQFEVECCATVVEISIEADQNDTLAMLWDIVLGIEDLVEQVISDAVNSILDNPEGIPLVMARQIFNVFEKESLWSFLG